MKGKLYILGFSLLFFGLLSACSPVVNASAPGTYSVDATFADFYREFGGISILGPAISPSFVKDGITYQYIVAGLMAYNPNKIPLERFHFSPIAAVAWNVNDLVEPATSASDLPYVNGHRIWEEVTTYYERYGQNIIGLPLTGVRVNDEKQRYEQYFEGLGFYRNYSDAPGKIQLMPYGSWMCGENCQYRGVGSSLPTASYARNYSETEQLFLQASERLGYGFTGSPLNAPTMGPDGFFEMIFENVVMFIDPANGNQIKLRPLPSWLGIQPDPPTEETKADWLAFYPTQENLGYNVPKPFIDFIAEHGDMAYFGMPITEYRLLPDGGYSQCYTNMCLEYHPTAPLQLQIRPHALGLEYKKNGRNTSVPDSSFNEALQLNVWEQTPLIASGQKQIINIEASKNNAPVAGIKLSLVVKQPDGIVKSYQLNPTGEGGTTSIELDPINGPNGSIIQYQVCIVDSISPQVCFSRSYTIWNQQ